MSNLSTSPDLSAVESVYQSLVDLSSGEYCPECLFYRKVKTTKCLFPEGHTPGQVAGRAAAAYHRGETHVIYPPAEYYAEMEAKRELLKMQYTQIGKRNHTNHYRCDHAHCEEYLDEGKIGCDGSMKGGWKLKD